MIIVAVVGETFGARLLEYRRAICVYNSALRRKSFPSFPFLETSRVFKPR